MDSPLHQESNNFDMAIDISIVFTIISVSVIIFCCCFSFLWLKNVANRSQNSPTGAHPTMIYSVTMNRETIQNLRDSVGEFVRNQNIETRDSTNNTTDTSRRWHISEGNFNSGFATEDFKPPPSYENIDNNPPSYQEVMTSSAQQRSSPPPSYIE